MSNLSADGISMIEMPRELAETLEHLLRVRDEPYAITLSRLQKLLEDSPLPHQGASGIWIQINEGEWYANLYQKGFCISGFPVNGGRAHIVQRLQSKSNSNSEPQAASCYAEPEALQKIHQGGYMAVGTHLTAKPAGGAHNALVALYEHPQEPRSLEVERADFLDWCNEENLDPKSSDGFMMWEAWQARAERAKRQKHD